MKFLVYVIMIAVLLLVGCLFATMASAESSEGLCAGYSFISFLFFGFCFVFLVFLTVSILQKFETKWFN